MEQHEAKNKSRYHGTEAVISLMKKYNLYYVNKYL